MKPAIFFLSLGQVIFFLGAYYFDISFPSLVWISYAIIGVICLTMLLWLTLREATSQITSWNLNAIGTIQMPLAIVLILILATFLRAKNLDVPIRVDEARTVVEFADATRVHPSALFTQYGNNNNHALNSLAIYITTGILSSSSPDVVRLPVFVVGILLVLLTYVVSKKVYQIPEIAYLAAFYIAISPFAIRYSINARGYIYITTFFSYFCG